MPDLSVDVTGLFNLSASLGRVKDGLDQTRSRVDDDADRLGAAEVLDALRDFDSHWKDGREQIGENLDHTTEALTSSAQAYEDADAELATALTEKSQA